MTALSPNWKFLDLVDQSRALGGTKLHLAVGAPPMFRNADRIMQPVDEQLPPVTADQLTCVVSTVVEPEKWDRLDQTGELAFSTSDGMGGSFKVSIFKANAGWTIVAQW